MSPVMVKEQINLVRQTVGILYEFKNCFHTISRVDLIFFQLMGFQE